MGRIAAFVASVLAAAVLAWPAVAQNAPPPSPAPQGGPAAEFSPFWVATHIPAEQWSSPGPDASSYGALPVGFPLLVIALQRGPRLLVVNPLTEGPAWVDAAAVGPIPEPTEEQIAALRAPPFEPWWAMTHRSAIAWSSPGEDAAAWGRIPQWRYLRVLLPEEGPRVLTMDPRNEDYAYVDISALGLVGPPPPEYFEGPPPDDETLALPGRVVGTADRYERPDREDYFALDPAFHNQPVTVQGLVDTGPGGTWYRTGSNAYIPSSGVRLPQLPDRTFPGRWIDANLTEPVLVTAYEGETPVYAALAVKGRIASQTPSGVFRIQRRVANETMDSATLGIPRTAPGGYYLRNVLFTQYFTGDGAALHYNYWRSDFGYAGSQGCLGMNYGDSQFFWEFGNVGTIVYVHF